MRPGFLLDTSFVSELSPGRKPLPETLAVWVFQNEHRFHLSMFTVAEVAAGVARLSRLGAAKRAEQYDTWLHHLMASTGDRVLAFDTRVARATGELLDLATARGKHPGFADVAIAATASVHGLTVLTANVRHFEPLGVAHADPFAALPG